MRTAILIILSLSTAEAMRPKSLNNLSYDYELSVPASLLPESTTELDQPFSIPMFHESLFSSKSDKSNGVPAPSPICNHACVAQSECFALGFSHCIDGCCANSMSTSNGSSKSAKPTYLLSRTPTAASSSASYSSKSAKPSWQTRSSTSPTRAGGSTMTLKPSTSYSSKSNKPSSVSGSPPSGSGYSSKSYKPTSFPPSDDTYSSKSYKPTYAGTPSYSSKSYKPTGFPSIDDTYSSKSYKPTHAGPPTTSSKSYKPTYAGTPSYSSKSYKPTYAGPPTTSSKSYKPTYSGPPTTSSKSYKPTYAGPPSYSSKSNKPTGSSGSPTRPGATKSPVGTGGNTKSPSTPSTSEPTNRSSGKPTTSYSSKSSKPTNSKSAKVVITLSPTQSPFDPWEPPTLPTSAPIGIGGNTKAPTKPPTEPSSKYPTNSPAYSPLTSTTTTTTAKATPSPSKNPSTCQEPSVGFCNNGAWDSYLCSCECFPGWIHDANGSCSVPSTSAPTPKPSRVDEGTSAPTKSPIGTGGSTKAPTKKPNYAPITSTTTTTTGAATFSPTKRPSFNPSTSPSARPTHCEEPFEGFCENGVLDCDECKCVCFPGWSVGTDGSCSVPSTSAPTPRPSRVDEGPSAPTKSPIGTGGSTKAPTKKPNYAPITSTTTTTTTGAATSSPTKRPSFNPSTSPSAKPTAPPSNSSSSSPTPNPSASPSVSPTPLPPASPTRSPVCQEPSDGFCIWGVWDCDECKCVCFPGWSVGPDGSCSHPITSAPNTSAPTPRPSRVDEGTSAPTRGPIGIGGNTKAPTQKPNSSPITSTTTTTTGAATSSPSKRPSFSPITLTPVTDAPVSSPPTASCQEPYPDFCLNGDWSVDQCGCICYPGTCLDQDGICCECGKYTPTTSPTVKPAWCEAKKIKLVSTTYEPLHMYEVQILSNDTNVALSGTAIQSSTYNGNVAQFGASKAIDGNAVTFSHTKVGSPGEWWELDLQSTTGVESIRILNKGCPSTPVCLCRLTGAVIHLYDSSENLVSTRNIGDTCNVDTVLENFDTC